jgi:hypothetical protein
MFAAGNQLGVGRSNPKPFASALKRVLAQSPESLRQIAETVIAKAKEGERWAVEVLADRLDGKAIQQVDVQQQVTQTAIDARQLAKEVAFILQAASATDAEIVSDTPTERVPALPAPEITAYDPDLADIKLTD